MKMNTAEFFGIVMLVVTNLIFLALCTMPELPHHYH
jgi:hypothetical protein